MLKWKKKQNKKHFDIKIKRIKKDKGTKRLTSDTFVRIERIYIRR